MFVLIKLEKGALSFFLKDRFWDSLNRGINRGRFFCVVSTTPSHRKGATHQSYLRVVAYWFALTICELTNAPQSLCVLYPFKVWIPGIQYGIDHTERMPRWLIDFFTDLADSSVCGRPVKWWIQWLPFICVYFCMCLFVCGQAGAVKDYIKMMLEAEQLKFLVFAHHLTMLQACTEAVIEAKVTSGRPHGAGSSR